MVAKPVKPRHKFHIGWRGLVVFLLVFIGITALTAFTIIHWTERQILTTENWVKVVGPLPKNDTVASALSTYTVDSLFTNLNVEEKIGQALPDRASFIAPTIADELQTRVTTRTKQIIQSDKFTSAWEAANRAAHSRLMASARNDPAPPHQARANFNLDLTAIKNSINSLLSRTGNDQISNSPISVEDKNANLGVDLKTSLDKLKTYIRNIDFLNGTIGLFALVCLLGAIIFSHFRRRLIVRISLVVLVITLLQLIGVKALRPAILNHLQDVAYRPAAGVVYDTLLSSFRRSTTLVALFSVVIFLITFFTQHKFTKRSKTLTKQLAVLRKSKLWLWMRNVRIKARQYEVAIMGIVVLLELALAAFVLNADWQGIVRTILFMVLSVELINLFANRSRSVPMM